MAPAVYKYMDKEARNSSYLIKNGLLVTRAKCGNAVTRCVIKSEIHKAWRKVFMRAHLAEELLMHRQVKVIENINIT